MTRYIFHYDLENPDLCLKAAPVLHDLHVKHEMPATFFMLGRVLEQKGAELRSIFGDDPLFDIQSHTYSHRMLRDSNMHGPGIPVEEVQKEISLGKKWVEDVFERECIGIRSGCGFHRGLQGESEKLGAIVEEGIKYISTDLRGPADTIPSGLVQGYWYDQDGFPDLLELPGHGWHDNVLKSRSSGWLCLPWPRYVDWGIPRRPPETPEEEFQVQKAWIDRGRELDLDYVSLVYHPHSIYAMSPDCKTVELIMQHVKEHGIPVTTYTALHKQYAAAPESVPGRDAWTWESERLSGNLW